jgi:two-component system, OmpR family, sensor kinase
VRAPRTVEDLEEALRGARDDAERLSRLADDLLVLARADQGHLAIRHEPLDVQDVLEETAARHAPRAGAARRIVVANGIDGGAVVLADPDHLARALDNLVVNALGHGGGDVEVSARLALGGHVAFSVRDHGPGWPEDFLPRAFDRFSQGDGTKGDGGSGLGLAIVRAIAEAHGGSASADDAPGGGARTTITVPLA